jgi:uncharacterized protein (TIGR03000 family)
LLAKYPSQGEITMTNKLPLLRVLLAAVALAALLFPAGAADPVPDNKALLIVRLPANARLTIADTPTVQTGSERTYISPPLTPGKDYYYVVKATWAESGQSRSEVREVVVRAGQKSQVDFNAPAPVAKAPEAKAEPATKAAQAKTRIFQFTYSATVTGLAEGKTARVWLPVAASNEHQEVEIADSKALPEGYKIDTEPAYGNKILYAEVKPDKDGSATLAVTYQVKRREVKGASPPDVPDAPKIARYLEPDTLVPITGKPLELIKGKAIPMNQLAAAKMLYDVVNNHMRYSKEGTGWGRGDSVWACDSKFGNCSDFHSLFISLARAQKIPAKFEIGFPLPSKRGAGDIGGYHCWAFFKPDGKGWVPVDISEANKDPKMKDYYFGNLTEDRVTFTTGRDYDLVPKQDGPQRNFFVYPYVEVDGKEYPADKVKRKFSFKDLGE